MIDKNYLVNARKHARVILTHKWYVFKGCAHVGLFWQGITHDLSKFSPTEFRIGVMYFQGNRSPNGAERDDAGFSTAWMHHKGRNKHHFEYWTDVPPDRSAVLAGVKMPPPYLAEMIMDRIAANKAYQGKAYNKRQPLEYLLKGRDYRLMHPETYNELRACLTILAEYGESSMYRHVRKLLKDGY